jgi:glycosyltransferase involved in cell wall biosynthesis
MPTVSVILVFHRDTPFLRPAINSILDQTFRDLELVLVDNGVGLMETDLGLSVGEDRPPIKWVRFPENRGIAHGGNAGFAAAVGEFAAFMDYDDIAFLIDAQGAQTGESFTLLSPAEQATFSQFSMPATSPTMMARTEVVRRLPYRPEFIYAPDFDFFSRVADNAVTAAIPEVLLHYRHHANQSTQMGHDSQTLSANIIRLLTARRRAGRPEDFANLTDELAAWRKDAPALAVQYNFFADRAWQENFPILGVFFARKLLSVDRSPRAVKKALQLVSMALGQGGGARVTLLRLFFTGPLRTYGLHRA